MDLPPEDLTLPASDSESEVGSDAGSDGYVEKVRRASQSVTGTSGLGAFVVSSSDCLPTR